MGLLLREAIQDVETIVEEATDSKPKGYYIQGIFLQAENENRNGRIYPRKILEKEVRRYNKEYVQKNRALGELGHPNSPSIQMERISHVITDLKQNGNDFIGRAKVIPEGLGKIARSLIDEGVKLGASSRGVGSLSEKSGKTYVDEDFMLSTAADIVHDPSGINCFIEGLVENKQWVWESGVWREKTLMREKSRIKRASKRQVESTILEAFERLMYRTARRK
jgi:hypothetical protein